MIWLLKAEDAIQLWPEIEPMLIAPCEMSSGRHTPQSTFERVRDGFYDVFVAYLDNAIKAVCVTQVSEYPASKWLTIILCGGEKMLDWLTEGRAVLDDWARRTGCIAIEVFGRPGWCKAMELVSTGVMMERKL